MRIGSIASNNYSGKRHVDIFLKAAIDNGKLSITGVIGPKSNGDADGGCGQISMEFEHRNPAHNDKRYSHLITPKEITFAPGWTADKWLDLLDIWETWHLNDMQAGCEHQTGPEWDTRRELSIYHFRLAPTVEDQIRDAKQRAKACITSGQTFTPTPEETRLANLPDQITYTTAELPATLARDYIANGPRYDKDHYNKPVETKTAGWVRQDEHPEGLLCKPCPVCGYKYGTEWRMKALPDSVAQFIQSLPDTDKTPAWV